jgi:hypothetical protein
VYTFATLTVVVTHTIWIPLAVIVVRQNAAILRAAYQRHRQLGPEVDALHAKVDAAKHAINEPVTARVSEPRTITLSLIEDRLTIADAGRGLSEDFQIHRVGVGDVAHAFGWGRWFLKPLRKTSSLPPTRQVQVLTDQRWAEAPDVIAVFAEGQYRHWRSLRRTLLGEPLVLAKGALDAHVLREAAMSEPVSTTAG